MIQEQPFSWQISATTADDSAYQCDLLKLNARLEIDLAPLVESIRSSTIEDCARVADSYRTNAAEHGNTPIANAFQSLSEEIRALKDREKNPTREE